MLVKVVPAWRVWAICCKEKCGSTFKKNTYIFESYKQYCADSHASNNVERDSTAVYALPLEKKLNNTL